MHTHAQRDPLPLFCDGRDGNAISAPGDADRLFAGGFATKANSFTLSDGVRFELFLKVSADCVFHRSHRPCVRAA